MGSALKKERLAPERKKKTVVRQTCCLPISRHLQHAIPKFDAHTHTKASQHTCIRTRLLAQANLIETSCANKGTYTHRTVLDTRVLTMHEHTQSSRHTLTHAPLSRSKCLLFSESRSRCAQFPFIRLIVHAVVTQNHTKLFFYLFLLLSLLLLCDSNHLRLCDEAKPHIARATIAKILQMLRFQNSRHTFQFQGVLFPRTFTAALYHSTVCLYVSKTVK